MSPLTTASEALPSLYEPVPLEMTRRHPVPLLRMTDIPAPEGHVDMARRELATVLQYWGYRPEMWRIDGFTGPVTEQSYTAVAVAHPIVEVMRSSVVVRRQSLSVSERTIVARHMFMRYLAMRGLPVPALLDRPDGTTYALVPVVPLTDPQQASGFTYVIEDAIYEVQTYAHGRRFVTDGPGEDIYLEAAAETLAALHRASLDFPGPINRWPHERAMLAIAQASLTRIADSAREANISHPIAVGMRRLARESAQWIAAAEARLAAHPEIPWLHVHGDYQPHNLAFEADHVCAIYDFDATHWDRRVLELAYALLTFAGLRWGEGAALAISAQTPPLVEHGLDIERARAFLTAYGQSAPPQPGEADLLGDALLLMLPIVFANGVAEDIVLGDGETRLIHPPREWRAHLAWAETFPTWIEAHRATLGDAWRSAVRH
ncbi:MAG TPA: phosphotransferase [Ktedonobacterales bacterium]|nr:phosphotransferase [Ktedonobacterales bacterium]